MPMGLAPTSIGPIVALVAVLIRASVPELWTAEGAAHPASQRLFIDSVRNHARIVNIVATESVKGGLVGLVGLVGRREG